MMRRIASASIGALVLGATSHVALADSTSGVDVELFRPSYDTSGVFSLEGGRVMTDKDIVWKVLVGYAQRPFAAPVPGIGMDNGTDAILKYAATVDMTFAMALTKKLTLGLDVAGYRTAPDVGFGVRGRYNLDPNLRTPSSGMISLRPLDSFDPSGSSSDPANNKPDQLGGPMDVRAGLKYALFSGQWSGALVATAAVPFGEDQMYMGDSGFVIEPKLAVDYHLDKIHASRIVFDVGARLRKRTALEAYDPATETPDQAHVVLDVGSEAIAGAGLVWELSPRVSFGVEDMLFIPLPSGMSFGTCLRDSGAPCSTITKSDYFANGGYGDFASYAIAGLNIRATASLGLQVLGGAGWAGDRGDQFHVSLGAVWTPQPEGQGEIGRGDRDGDGLPDTIDQCPDEPEDKDGYQDDDGCPDLDNDGDGIPDINDKCPNEPEDKDNFQDEDGCPDRDNDDDGIPDITDRCPNEKEDFDGFEDEDGCADEDNDGDGFADENDKCPNDKETVNGYEDEDGCPDTRATTGPIEASDRINLQGQRIDFSGNTDKLTGASKTILNQVATLIKGNKDTIRIEVHVAQSTHSKNAGQIAAARKRDKSLSQARANAIQAYLFSQNVPQPLITGAVGLGSDRPFGNNPPDDPINERVDFIKAQQRGGTP